MQYFGYKNIVALVFLAAIVFFISSHYLDSQQKKANSKLLDEIRQQEISTYELAQSVKSSSLTESLAEFVNDCSAKHRSQFDNKLDKLASLKTVEIEELEPLFDACADYFADVKTALVFQLELEINELKRLVEIAKLNDQGKMLSVSLDSWQSYLDLEKQLAKALREQVSSQEEIITLLKSGQPASGSEVQKMVLEARELSERASVTAKQINTVFLTLAP